MVVMRRHNCSQRWGCQVVEHLEFMKEAPEEMGRYVAHGRLRDTLKNLIGISVLQHCA